MCVMCIVYSLTAATYDGATDQCFLVTDVKTHESASGYHAEAEQLFFHPLKI